jgi:sulfur-oxidizing protein SoxY
MSMNLTRRRVLRAGGAAGLCIVAAGSFITRGARAAVRPEFEVRSLDDFKAPDIAENGAVVPVEIESALPNTRAIAIVVEKNPHALSANFSIPDGTDAFVATRVKVAETSNLYALVKTDTGYFYATKLVKVTLGGCGG